ncbi:MAG: Ig-like domain-containing protein [Gemmatimonadaceae bacterium]|nr:Ig-like domain-containing protein [Gemmatimonadaceae bacterium]
MSSLVACVAGDRAGQIMSPASLPVDSIIRLRSDSFFLTVGDNAAIAATVTSIAGDRAPDGPIHWTSEDSAIVAVDVNGLVTGVSPGSARVTATFDDDTRVNVQVFVTSVLRPVSRLVISPPTVNLITGNTARVTVQALDDAGIPVAGAIIAFGSDSTQIATARVTTTRTRELNQVFVIGAVSPGATLVTATSQGATTSAPVVVTPVVTPVSQVTVSPANVTLAAGGAVRLTSQVLDRIGHPVAGATVAYASDASPVAVVDQSGLITAVGPGTARITATSHGVNTISQVNVTTLAPRHAGDGLAVSHLHHRRRDRPGNSAGTESIG